MTSKTEVMTSKTDPDLVYCINCRFHRVTTSPLPYDSLKSFGPVSHECHLEGDMDYVTGQKQALLVVDCYTRNSDGKCPTFIPSGSLKF